MCSLTAGHCKQRCNFRQIEDIFRRGGAIIQWKWCQIVINLSTKPKGTIDNYQLSTDSPQRASKPWPGLGPDDRKWQRKRWVYFGSRSVQSMDTVLTLPVHCRQACQAIRLTISCVSETFSTSLRSSFRGQNSGGFIAIPCNYAFSETQHR